LKSLGSVDAAKVSLARSRRGVVKAVAPPENVARRSAIVQRDLAPPLLMVERRKVVEEYADFWMSSPEPPLFDRHRAFIELLRS
jgi:hypothetical protein